MAVGRPHQSWKCKLDLLVCARRMRAPSWSVSVRGNRGTGLSNRKRDDGRYIISSSHRHRHQLHDGCPRHEKSTSAHKRPHRADAGRGGWVTTQNERALLQLSRSCSREALASVSSLFCDSLLSLALGRADQLQKLAKATPGATGLPAKFGRAVGHGKLCTVQAILASISSRAKATSKAERPARLSGLLLHSENAIWPNDLEEEADLLGMAIQNSIARSKSQPRLLALCEQNPIAGLGYVPSGISACIPPRAFPLTKEPFFPS